MPPKRKIDSEDDTEEVESTDESDVTTSEETLQHNMSGGNEATPDVMLVNNPNDERHIVEDARPVRTPIGVDTPQRPQSPEPPTQLQAGDAVQMLRNNPNDEMVPVNDGIDINTPRAERNENSGEPKGLILRNAPHDEAIPLSGRVSSVGTPKKSAPKSQLPMDPEEDEEESSDEKSEEQGGGFRGYANQRPGAIDAEAETTPTVIPNLEYKPQDYAKINASASREMQELFKHILDYQPVIPELPAKLRPFIPDYVPSIGDLDPFCKIPRPDGKPDGLGIYVLDEPSVSQSNPAVVLLELRATNIHSSGGLAEVVDSFEDAANRPEVIDRWIADVKKVHYKKPLPTINYQKPMPEIESLLQVWPPEFEEVLNSDLQFPPPHIDLDLDQYVRTLCCILDIPTYNSLIDSLHVMFTLYQEFRANQHFQHE
ncbi:Intraflagellar transport complex B protein 46 [Trypanosoma melophagium]|uniref:Intraflagellar transport complex B protein 46 n=1 Tax=Trypanosoma melophagium TaxID=715481 RepID=UPI00351A0336|nr:Intraflagellar transport complex B protein 46 [Trypanosoma melophagium]